MIEATWTLNLLSGPVVGSATADTPEDAWAAVRAAWKGAVGKSWGPDHEAAVARLQAASRASLATGDDWTHTSVAVVVSLRRTADHPNLLPLEWRSEAAAEAWLFRCRQLWGSGRVPAPDGWRPLPPEPSPWA